MTQYVRHSIVDIDSVLTAVSCALKNRSPHKKEKIKAVFNGQRVGVHSLRLQTFFVHGTTCKGCGLKASYFALERNHTDERNNASYHLNLWGINDQGREILFTHDHILAYSLGGKDSIDNCQTMCSNCNQKKSVIEHQQIELLRRQKQ